MPITPEVAAALDETVRAYLVSIARDGSTRNPPASLITYKALSRAVDPNAIHFKHPRYTRLHDCLFRIANAERDAGRPKLTSLVVCGAHDSKWPGQPGAGFFTRACLPGEIPANMADIPMVWWRSQVAATIGYWSGRADAAVAAAG